MVDTTDNGFRAAIHALREIVAPAVDPAHPMAREQVALVIDWLEFQRVRIPLLGERQRAELAANLAMAHAIDALALPLDVAGLGRAIAAAEAALAAADARHEDRAAALDALEEALGEAVTRAADLSAADRAAVEGIVVRGSAPLVALQRAWFLPYGLEADPASLPLLDAALTLAATAPGASR